MEPKINDTQFTKNETKNAEKTNNVTKDLFINVYGYEDVKNELSRIRSWLTNEEYLNNKNIMLPKGVLFHGRPGNGKTLILRDFANSFNAPIFVIEGESNNINAEITAKFKSAREEKFAIVLIDEIDLLIDKDSRATRALQQELDGINNKGQILVLATTNSIYTIPDALTRPGRFDRIIEIDYPDRESRKEIFKKFIAQLEANDEKVNYDHVSKVCSQCNGATIKAICNDAYLRCGKNLTTEEIENSYDRIIDNDYSNKSANFKDFRVAVHEAGHALMALSFKDNWTFYTAKFNATGGVTEIQEASERTDTIEKREQNIMISLGGFIAEEICLGHHDVGSWSDFGKAQEHCERLLERVCFKGIGNLVPSYYIECNDRHWSDKKVRNSEAKTKKLMKKYERKTKKYLTKHKDDLMKFANIMYQQGKCTYKDVQSFTSSR